MGKARKSRGKRRRDGEGGPVKVGTKLDSGENDVIPLMQPAGTSKERNWGRKTRLPKVSKAKRDGISSSGSERSQRMRQIQSAARKRDRQQLERIAARGNLPTNKLQLLRSSSEMGVGDDTLRRRLSRELWRQRAGLGSGEDASRLVVEAPSPKSGGGDISNRTADSSDAQAHAKSLDLQSQLTSVAAGEAGKVNAAMQEKAATRADDDKTSLHMSATHHNDEHNSTKSDAPAPRAMAVAPSRKQPQPTATSKDKQSYFTVTARSRQTRKGRVSVSAARELLRKTRDEFSDSVSGSLSGSSSSDEDDDDEASSNDSSSSESDSEASADDRSEAKQADLNADAELSDVEADDEEEDDEGIDDADDHTDSDNGNEAHSSPILIVPPASSKDVEYAPLPKVSDPLGLRSNESVVPLPKRKYIRHVTRAGHIDQSRNKLPIVGMEQEIMEAIEENNVVVISGATGTGKTTQLPQFLFEYGYGNPDNTKHQGIIVVTQPRRISAMSCATRVAEELNAALGDVVGYQTRYRALFGESTQIKFVTDGILLRETEENLLLPKYSAIIVDEAHERSINTDLLLTLLSRSVKLRGTQTHELKLIIMSATLNVDGILTGSTPLFSLHSHLEVPSRQYPVTVHFSRRTSTDYIDEALSKTCKIHNRLPRGDVLVFVTGKTEVEDLCRRLRTSLGDSANVLPLYAMLPEKLQRRVFAEDESGLRKIIVATNVAETSITIPNVVYVVDTGRVKKPVYHSAQGKATSMSVVWASKAAAQQREGRAGRTRAGHCYRLYSSAVYQNEFEDHDPPIVQLVPVDGLVLRLRSMGITDVHNFPLPSKPAADGVRAAETLLRRLEATDEKGGVTDIGELLAALPVEPRYGKVLLMAARSGCTEQGAYIAALLSVGNVLLQDAVRLAAPAASAQKTFHNAESEILSAYNLLRGAAAASKRGGLQSFCNETAMNARATQECLHAARQLHRDYLSFQGHRPGASGSLSASTLTHEQERALVDALLCAFPDQVARRVSPVEARERGIRTKSNRLLFALGSTSDMLGYVPRRDGLDSIDLVCYSELLRLSPTPESTSHPELMRLVGLTRVTSTAVARHCRELCTFTAVLAHPAPFYDAVRDATMCFTRASYGVASLPLGVVAVSYRNDLRAGTMPSCYQVFALALLRGEVESCLKAHAGDILRPAESVLHGATALAAELGRHAISSRRDLRQRWRVDANFLLPECLHFYDPAVHTRLRRQWPPIEL